MGAVGLDMGTSFVKAARVDGTGQVEALVERHVPWAEPERGPAEAVLDAAQAALQAVWNDRVEALGLSAAMHSLVPVDARLEPHGPTTTWQVREGEATARALADGAGAAWWEETGTPLHPMTPAVRWIWALGQRGLPPGSRPRALKDPLVFRLTGEDVTDFATQAAGGWLDRRSGGYHEGVLKTAGLITADFPRLEHPEAIIGTWRGVPVMVGSTDGVTAHRGLGAGEQEASVGLGTSGAVRRLRPGNGPSSLAPSLFSYVVDRERSLVGGALADAGNLLEWWAGVCGASVQETLAEAAAGLSVPGRPLALPFWHGMRAPWWEAGWRGSLLGVDSRHTRGDIAASLLEGVLLTLAWAARELDRAVGAAPVMRAGGGLFRAPGIAAWAAAYLDRPLALVSGRDAAVLGAARLAWEGLGREPWPMPAGELVFQSLTETGRERAERFREAVEECRRSVVAGPGPGC
jgi:gluconokinase